MQCLRSNTDNGDIKLPIQINLHLLCNPFLIHLFICFSPLTCRATHTLWACLFFLLSLDPAQRRVNTFQMTLLSSFILANAFTAPQEILADQGHVFLVPSRTLTWKKSSWGKTMSHAEWENRISWGKCCVLLFGVSSTEEDAESCISGFKLCLATASSKEMYLCIPA